MSYLHNSNFRNLSAEQQRLVSMYVHQYNQTYTYINLLFTTLDQIRGNILHVINTSQSRRNRHSRNSNLNIDSFINQILNDRQNNFVNYDYDNPINPSIYNNLYENSYSRNSYSRNNLFDMSLNRINRNNSLNNTQNNNSDLLSFFTNFLNANVVVQPTNEQIENASRVIRYGDIENPLSQSCPISLDEFADEDQVRQILYCGHIFHQPQFQEWFESNVRCPVCRYDIRNYRPSTRRNYTTNLNSENTEVNTPVVANISTHADNQNIHTDNQNTHPISNVNILRDPVSNQIDQFSFDINDSQITNNIINRLTRNIFQSLFNPNATNSNDRFMIDPSNNILFYETIITPNDVYEQEHN